jgi:hypothetical protein
MASSDCGALRRLTSHAPPNGFRVLHLPARRWDVDLLAIVIHTFSLIVRDITSASKPEVAVFDTQSVFGAIDAHKPVVLAQRTLATVGINIWCDRHGPIRSHKNPIKSDEPSKDKS